MFARLIDMIKEAIRKMVAYKDITDFINTEGVDGVTDEMTQAFET